MYALKVCKIFGPKIRSCKFFDKSQVCTWDAYVNSILHGVLKSTTFPIVLIQSNKLVTVSPMRLKAGLNSHTFRLVESY